MDARDGGGKESVAREGEEHAGDRKRHAAHVAEHRERGADQDERASPWTGGNAGCRGQRSRLRGERRPEHSLRRDLDGEVDGDDRHHGEEDGAGSGARWIADLAAGHQRGLDAEEGEDEEQRGARDVAARRCPGPAQVFGAQGEESESDQHEQRDELRRSQDGVEAARSAHPAHVEAGEERKDDEDHRSLSIRGRERRDERSDGIGEERGHCRERRGEPDPEQDAGDEADQRPEGHLDVRVHAARQRDAACRLGEAEDDERHGGGANDIGKGGGRAEQGGDAARQAEDPAADGDVHDPGGEPHDTDGADERAFGGAGGPSEVQGWDDAIDRPNRPSMAAINSAREEVLAR